MGFIDFIRSEKGKQITGCAYSLGASVVIVGALFKIQHWPGAGPMLCVGMFTEAILFGLGCFDKPHKEFDWSLAYPELEGGEANEKDNSNAKSNALAIPEVDTKALVEEKVQMLAKSVDTLNTTAGQIASISSAAAESQTYVQNLNKATQAASAFAASQASLTNASDALVSSYQNIASSIGAASNGSQNFAAQMDGITKNISTINSVFELQVQSVNAQNEAMKGLAGAVTKIQQSLDSSAQSAEDYKQQVATLANQMKQLNSVYGGMLNAMTIRG